MRNKEVLAAKKQIVLLRSRSRYMSDAEPIDAAMHSDSADTIQKAVDEVELLQRASK